MFKFMISMFIESYRVSWWRSIVLISILIISSILGLVPSIILGFIVSMENISVETLFILFIVYVSILVGSRSSQYLFYNLYGFLEQRGQSNIMVSSYISSVKTADLNRNLKNKSEISFAIDSLAGVYRDTISILYLTIIPAFISFIAGFLTLYTLGGITPSFIFIISSTLLFFVSYPIIKKHQKSISIFFSANMESFGILENLVSLWREIRVARSFDNVEKRYTKNRRYVETLGMRTYRWTICLHGIQGIVIIGCILIIISTYIWGKESIARSDIGILVSILGVVIGSIYPLTSLGFSISSIAVNYATFNEANIKINSSKKILTIDNSLQNVEEIYLESKVYTSCIDENINLRQGRPIWILGDSGSGKTVFIERILGLQASEKGNIDPLISSPMRYMTQEGSMLIGNIRENISLEKYIDLGSLDDSLSYLNLDQFSSSGSRYNMNLAGEGSKVSGGEARRIALIRALHNSKGQVVVLDEPTTGLDIESAKKAWKYIEKQSKDAIVLVVTHDSNAPILQDDIIIRLKK